jgi:CRISPR-associated protein Cas2
MYILLVYDIGEKRVGKTLKVCRRYLNWVHNSVFEGELSPAKLKALKLALKQVIHPKEDSVLIYKAREQSYLTKEVMGLEKSSTDQFL